MVLIQWLLVAIAGTLLMAAFFASCWVLGQSVTLLFGG